MGPPLVELRRVTLRFGSQQERPIFEDLDLILPDPCWTALVGPSGSGKTSLIQFVAGLERPTSGQVWVAGERIDNAVDGKLSLHRQRTVGTAFQHFHVQTERTVMENLLLPLHFSGADIEEGKARAQEFCEFLELAPLVQQPVRQLSGGQRQRLALARALMNRPRLLLADEPIGNLDAASAERVLSLLLRERERGLSMLLITHDDFLLRDVDQVYRLEAGKLNAA